MKTMMIATATMLGIGVGSAFAGDGEGPVPNTRFTEIPGVIAQARVPEQAPTAVARNQFGTPTAAYVTQHGSYMSLSVPNPNKGSGG